MKNETVAVDYAVIIWQAEGFVGPEVTTDHQHGQGGVLMDFTWFGYWARQYEEPPEDMWGDYEEEEFDE